MEWSQWHVQTVLNQELENAFQWVPTEPWTINDQKSWQWLYFQPEYPMFLDWLSENYLTVLITHYGENCPWHQEWIPFHSWHINFCSSQGNSVQVLETWPSTMSSWHNEVTLYLPQFFPEAHVSVQYFILQICVMLCPDAIPDWPSPKLSPLARHLKPLILIPFTGAETSLMVQAISVHTTNAQTIQWVYDLHHYLYPLLLWSTSTTEWT